MSSSFRKATVKINGIDAHLDGTGEQYVDTDVRVYRPLPCFDEEVEVSGIGTFETVEL